MLEYELWGMGYGVWGKEASVGAGEDDEEEEDEEEGGSRKRKRGGGKAKGPKRAKGDAVVLGAKALAALRAGGDVPIGDLAKKDWVPGLGEGKVAHLQSAEGWKTCGALAQASRAEVEAWRAKLPAWGPAAVTFVVQLAAALKAAGEGGAGGAGRDEEEEEVEVEVAEDEEEEEEEEEDDDDDDDLLDAELDAGEPESESDASDDESDEEWGE